MSKPHFKPNVYITNRQIMNLLCCAFEGGSNYWYRNLDVKSLPPGAKEEDYTNEAIKKRSNGFWLRYYVIPVEGGTVELEAVGEPGKLELHRGHLKRGLQLLVDKYPSRFADVISEHEDGSTGDIFLQLCLFGEVPFA
tara:strand:+ start:145 stop:558 length:414 start_codon:yes stop_codon:yes gene_type:complete